MRTLKLILPIFLLFSLTFLHAQERLESKDFTATIDPHGRLTSCTWRQKGDSTVIAFRQDEHAGFSFKGITLESDGTHRYGATIDGIRYQIQYGEENGRLKVTASLENCSGKIFVPETGVKLLTGIDTYMEKYPDWDQIFFPTLQRCEKTHFCAYYMSPEGKILVMGSPDPVSSWSNEYETRPKKTPEASLQIGAHRIYTTSIDLLHRLPLPQRHPQESFSLAPGAEKRVILYLQLTDDLEKVNPILEEMTQAPILSARLYTLAEGERFEGKILSDEPIHAEIRTPRNEVHELKLSAIGTEGCSWNYLPVSGTGTYTVSVQNTQGKLSEMRLFVRPPFTTYLQLARKEGLRSRPTATHHAECFYPFYTYFLAARHLPDKEADQKARQVFDSLYPVLYDSKAGEMRNGKYRLQDAATMAGILSDRYQVTGEKADLKAAAYLVDYLLSCQGEDGALYVPEKHVHYSSVIYPIKSIMEVMEQEKDLALKSKQWEKEYSKQLKGVLAATDNLALLGDNIGTEGQMTFEDGMVSCTITQLALAALKLPDGPQRQAYLQQAEHLWKKHRCLTQSLIPDARMNGATLRFWEYQYAVNLMHNAFNSPCGWTCWKLYGDWYLYLLTGKPGYLQDFLNGMGSALQLLNIDTGKLNFSFLADPYIDAEQFTETPIGSRRPVRNRVIVGEQYIPQISFWHKADPYAWRPTKFGIDNFVHEVFKCMSETLLENAFILETDEGLKGINCHLEESGENLIVHFNDRTVSYLHVNLQHPHTFIVDGKSYMAEKGYGWLTGTPESLKAF